MRNGIGWGLNGDLRICIYFGSNRETLTVSELSFRKKSMWQRDMGWIEGESDRDGMGNRRLLLKSKREVMTARGTADGSNLQL